MKINTALRKIQQEFPPEIIEIFEAGIEAKKSGVLEGVIEILQECVEVNHDEGAVPPSETVERLKRFLEL